MCIRDSDYRATSGIHLVVLFLMMSFNMNPHDRYVAIDCIPPVLATVSLFYALARPCKQNYANILQSLLLILTAFVMLLFSSVRFHHRLFSSFLIALLCLLTPHVVLGGYVIFKVIKKIGVNHLWNQSYKIKMYVPVKRGEDNCLVHDQLCPNECSPLLN